MNKYIWLVILLGLSFLTGCGQREAVMTASDKGKNLSEGQTAGAAASGTEGALSDLENQNQGTAAAQDRIYVYVCGHVEKPGVYQLSADARICDALELAGGVTAEGCPEALNQAEHMTDGQTLYVPGMEEETEKPVLEDDGLVDINQADREAFMTLPGIGESKAEVIIQYREEHGAFKSIEELMQIPGIKEGVFNKIKGSIKCR